MAATETTFFSPPQKRTCKTLWCTRWEACIDSYREFYDSGRLAYEETPEGVERAWDECGAPKYESTKEHLLHWYDDGTPHWYIQHGPEEAATEWQITGEVIRKEGHLRDSEKCKELARARFQAMKERAQRLKYEGAGI